MSTPTGGNAAQPDPDLGTEPTIPTYTGTPSPLPTHTLNPSAPEGNDHNLKMILAYVFAALAVLLVGSLVMWRFMRRRHLRVRSATELVAAPSIPKEGPEQVTIIHDPNEERRQSIPYRWDGPDMSRLPGYVESERPPRYAEVEVAAAEQKGVESAGQGV